MSDSCDVALAELYEYLDGELTEAARQRIEQHARDSFLCRESFAFVADVRRIVAVRCRASCPEALRTRIQSAIDGSGATA